MVLTIIRHVPLWVWLLLAGLLALGLSQTVTRYRTLRGATLFPIVMAVFSFYGVVQMFAAQGTAVAAWAIGAGGALALSNAIDAWRSVRWSLADRQLVIPGSWAPMFLILGIFAVKFGLNIAVALHPGMLANPVFVMAASIVCGLFSGIFLGRAAAMWRAVRRSELTAAH